MKWAFFNPHSKSVAEKLQYNLLTTSSSRTMIVLIYLLEILEQVQNDDCLCTI